MAKNRNSGFTLIELLLAMAIIGIISGAVLVSITSQRKRAHESRMLAELSGTIQPMLMCRTDGNSINRPTGTTGGVNICVGLPAYGTWPSLVGTDFDNAADYQDGDPNDDFDDGGWSFYIDDGTRRVCCNSGSAKCHDLASGGPCMNATP
ncbi:MAG: type II secretion system protein [Patescibacteria group bacterium]|nr:type II secretion system protein [Patescibacteria group bacterium]